MMERVGQGMDTVSQSKGPWNLVGNVCVIYKTMIQAAATGDGPNM
jgi:hypothetical protein